MTNQTPNSGPNDNPTVSREQTFSTVQEAAAAFLGLAGITPQSPIGLAAAAGAKTLDDKFGLNASTPQAQEDTPSDDQDAEFDPVAFDNLVLTNPLDASFASQPNLALYFKYLSARMHGGNDLNSTPAAPVDPNPYGKEYDTQFGTNDRPRYNKAHLGGLAGLGRNSALRAPLGNIAPTSYGEARAARIAGLNRHAPQKPTPPQDTELTITVKGVKFKFGIGEATIDLKRRRSDSQQD